MATAITEKELLELERKFWQAMKDRDVESARRLTEFPCIVSGPQGVGSIDERTLEAMMKNGPELIDFRLKDGAQMRKISDDVAVLAYEVHEELTVEGSPVSIDAAECSTWVRKEGRWVCAQHSEAIEGDPFGRDKEVAPGSYRSRYAEQEGAWGSE